MWWYAKGHAHPQILLCVSPWNAWQQLCCIHLTMGETLIIRYMAMRHLPQLQTFLNGLWCHPLGDAQVEINMHTFCRRKSMCNIHCVCSCSCNWLLQVLTDRNLPAICCFGALSLNGLSAILEYSKALFDPHPAAFFLSALLFHLPHR